MFKLRALIVASALIVALPLTACGRNSNGAMRATDTSPPPRTLSTASFETTPAPALESGRTYEPAPPPGEQALVGFESPSPAAPSGEAYAYCPCRHENQGP